MHMRMLEYKMPLKLTRGRETEKKSESAYIIFLHDLGYLNAHVGLK